MSARAASSIADSYVDWRRRRRKQQQLTRQFSGDRWWQCNRRESYWRQLFVRADSEQQRSAVGDGDVDQRDDQRKHVG